MNLQECYKAMGADYEDVMRRLGTEERVIRFLTKLLRDKSFEILSASLQAGDYEEAFRAAHSLKGICMNFGLTALQDSSSALTESLRNGNPGEDAGSLYQQVKEDYQTVIDTIGVLLKDHV